MTTFSPILSRRALVGGTAALALAGCVRTTADYLFRIEFGVRVDGVLRQAVTTRSFKSVLYPRWMLSANPGHTEIKGTAASVDIGQGRVLFLSLYGLRPRVEGVDDVGERRLAGQWGPPTLWPGRGLDQEPARNGLHSGIGRRAILAPHELPALIMMDDVTRPATARLLQPEALSRLHPNVALAQTVLSFPRFGRVSRDPVIARMPWLKTAGRPIDAPGLDLDRYTSPSSLFVS